MIASTAVDTILGLMRVSEEMLRAAHQRIYLPMYGWSDSFNLSVAAALVLQVQQQCRQLELSTLKEDYQLRWSERKHECRRKKLPPGGLVP